MTDQDAARDRYNAIARRDEAKARADRREKAERAECKTEAPTEPAIRRTFRVSKLVYLDRIEADWRALGLQPMTPQGSPGVNNAHSITREGRTLSVITTEGKHLTWKVRGRK